jgi:hypothetical protein
MKMKMIKRSNDWGRVTAPIVTEWLETNGHRDMRVKEQSRYVDRYGNWWMVLPGSVINGAGRRWHSKILLCFACRILPKFVGRYRTASVFHDRYCQLNEYPSWMVHRMFYECMRCKGVGPIQAWVMWAAVRLFGPRFSGRVRK